MRTFKRQAVSGSPWRRIVGGIVGLCVLALCSVSVASATSRAGHWVGLGSGHFGAYSWSIETKRPTSGQQNPQRPCLLVGTKWDLGRFNYRRSRSRQCADGPGLNAAGPPLIASGIQPSTKTPRMTAVGMIFAARVARVRIIFSDGHSSTIPLELLDRDQARGAGLGKLRYAALAVHGAWCPDRVISESASGKTLWDSGPGGYSCAYDVSLTTDQRP